MHILMAANDTTFIYNLRREVLQKLLAQGCRVSVMCQTLGFQQELQSMGCRIFPVEIERQGKNPLADLRLFRQYYTVLKTERPDVVLSNNIKPNVYAGAACRMLHIRLIANITGLGTPLENSGVLQRFTIQLYKAGVAGAECLFFQNAENLQFFAEHGMLPRKAKRLLLPGSGVNLRAHPPLPYPDGPTLHFQYTSRILKEKGIEIYLAAAQAIHARHPNTVFHICGGCDDKKYLSVLAQAEAERFVLYHGEQKDMTPFLRQACCIVHPSYYPEGMSNVLLEGAASARPVIAADRSGCRETVEDGVTGFLIPVQNVQALVDALEKLIAMPWEARKAMGLAGRARMEREFDRERVVDAYWTAICSTAEQSGVQEVFSDGL